ncbi:ATP-dependent 6-phosphofructokinase [Thalassotalea algicola]
MSKQNTIRRIGILTSGGDAPGMNAAIRAVVLAAHQYSIECIGFFHGYNGLINQEYRLLDNSSVKDIIHKGGTILKSARCPEMLSETGVKQAVNSLIKLQIDALIVIGGDGSFNGMLAIEQHWQGQLIGLPGTIDNDLDGTDFTIGFSTAINTAIEAIDKIRDTADAFDRVFVVELMGRHSGHIAFNVGIACGAEQIISFENFNANDANKKVNEIVSDIKHHQSQDHQSYLIVLAENLWPNGAQSLSEQLKLQYSIDCGTCILGHIQRGGSPVAKDRLLATKLGVAAIEAVLVGKTSIMLGELKTEIEEVTLNDAVQHTKIVAENLVVAHENILALAAQNKR